MQRLGRTSRLLVCLLCCCASLLLARPASTPVVDSITPGIALLYGRSFTITVNGRNFDSNSKISVGGGEIVTTVVSPTTLTGVVTASTLTTPGTVAVKVGSSNAVDLKVVERGDINGDRSMNIADALAVALYSAGILRPPLPVSAGDLNLNGTVNVADALIAALFSGGTLMNLPAPSITAVSPELVVAGQALTITGTGFSSTATENQVLFRTASNIVTRVVPAEATTTTLKLVVPVNAVSGPIQAYRLDMPVGGTEYAIEIRDTATPLVLTSITPERVSSDATVILEGLGFDPTPANNEVNFRSSTGTVKGVVTSATGRLLNVKVPQGAVCGEVTVQTGTRKSNGRAVLISGTPCTPRVVDYFGGADAGETLVIDGTGWNVNTPSSNVVAFTTAGGTVIAPVLQAGRTQLQVRVPENAIDGLLTVAVGDQASNALIYRKRAAAAVSTCTYPISGIALVDPATNTASSEVLVREGGSIQAPIRILDSTGAACSEVSPTFSSANPDVATISPSGNIQGKKAGFSTLVVSAGNVVLAATITVVQVQYAGDQTEATGVAVDQAQRLYLASAVKHTILSEDKLDLPAQVYAGRNQVPGITNDVRLQSLFRNPSFIALDRSDGTLYVSDSGNNVIRRVRPGPQGRVETYAGTGAQGKQNGPLLSATFNNPQGIALDESGNLWVADTGNHTIRLIRLAAGTVDTIAGLVGEFDSPMGIAIETEPVSQQLERYRVSGAKPQSRLLVADAGSGRIRRVRSDGYVETIGVLSGDGLVADSAAKVFRSTLPLIFQSPRAVASDGFGNIFVSESATGQVEVILPNGSVVPAAPANTFANPGGLAPSQSGRIVVADSQHTAELHYGEPEITSITPSHAGNKGNALVTVAGNNFSPGAVLLVGGTIITNAIVGSTQQITFTTPVLPSGITTVTVQTRGGIAQRSWVIDPEPLASLSGGQITTLAGGATFLGDGTQAVTATLFPSNEVVDRAGNLYVTDNAHNRVRKINVAGVITTIAGTGEGNFGGDGGLAVAAKLYAPQGIAIDAGGDLYIADTGNHRIRKLTLSTGIITTVAGNGIADFLGDNGLATSAALSLPSAVAFDSSGNLYIADAGNNRIRKITAATGVITTIAGNGPVTFSFPQAIVIDHSDNIYVADTSHHVIRKIDTAGGIQTIAGNGSRGFAGDNGTATAAQLASPNGVALDSGGNLFIADSGNKRIRKVDANGVITTIAGTGLAGFSGDNGPAVSAALSLPVGLAVDGAGDLFVADVLNMRLRRIDALTSVITTVAGNGEFGYVGDSQPATASGLNFPQGVAYDSFGNLYVTDTNRIRKVSAATGVISTFAGTGVAGCCGDNGVATSALLNSPEGLAVDSANNIFVADSGNNRVRRIEASTGIITPIAGTDLAGFSGDDGPATSAELNNPRALALSADGSALFIADSGNNRIRKLNLVTGVITTIAGNGNGDFSGDGGQASGAALNSPIGIALDPFGNLFIADYLNSRIRKVTLSTGVITTIAGTGGVGSGGDGGPANQASVGFPTGLLCDSQGNLFITDPINSRIRKIAVGTNVITTIAGNGQSGFSGDNGPATAATLSYPLALTFDGAGNLVFTDPSSASRIRAVKAPLP